MAISQGAIETVRWMLQHGARIDAVDRNGDTPLLGAMTLSKNEEMVKLLIESGADITHQNRRGQTALDLASKDLLPLLRRAQGKAV
jgi:ankyrin repeat protein